MVGRVLVLVAALLVAAIGAGLVLLYVREADSRAVDAAEGVEVLVATELIPAGTPMSDVGLRLVLIKVPDDARFPDSLPTLDPALADQVLLNDLQPKQQLQSTNIGTSVVSDTLDISTTGENLVQFVIDDPRRVSGFAQDGSLVALYASFPAVGEQPACTQMLSQGIEIAAIGTVAAGAAVDPVTGLAPVDVSTNVTFRLAPESDLGQRLIQADVDGDFSLVVVGGGRPPPTPTGDEKCLTTGGVLAYDAEPVPAATE